MLLLSYIPKLLLIMDAKVKVDNLKDQTGFTIIELMIIVAMISVLAAVAIPSYENYIQKSYAKAAAAVMQKDLQFMEKWYSINGKYTTGSAWPTLPYMVAPESGESQYYIRFSSATASDNVYKMKALPICGSSASNHNSCCVNWSDRNASYSPATFNGDCAICMDQDGNVVYGANWGCVN